MGDVVAPMRVGHETFRAFGRPLDRPPDLAGGPGHDRLFGVVVDLRSEAAADVGRDDPQPRFGDVQHKGAHQQTDHMRVLARRVERVFAGRAIELADRGARLHRVGDEAVVGEVELDDPRRLGKGGLDRGEIAEMPVVAEIARRLGVHLRRARLQRRRPGRWRQVPRHNRHSTSSAASRAWASALGDHDRHRVAHIADPVNRQHRVRRLGHRRAVLRVDLPAAGQPADAVGCHLLAGVDGNDAGCLLRCGGVDAGDPRMRMRAAQNVGVELTGAVDVVGVGAAAGQKAVILTPPNRRSDRGHRPYSAATPWTLGGVSPRITAAPSAIARTML